jgi:hypothetical protein
MYDIVDSITWALKVLIIPLIIGVIVGFAFNWGLSNIVKRYTSECVEVWAPRETKMVRGNCMVKIDGQWWPSEKIKVEVK